MNILPLISAFILIFAIGSYTFVHNYLSAYQEKEHFTGAMHLSHQYGRRLQAKEYRKIKGKNLHPKDKKGSDKKREETTYKSPRDRFYPYPDAKLNIRPLLTASNPKLEKIFLDLVSSLYNLTPLKDTEVGPLLLKLIKQSDSIEALHELIELAPENKRTLVYKALKGTQNYELDSNHGYPALGDFIRIGKEKEKPIHFCHATHALLNVLVGENVTPLIINEEAHKWKENKQKHTPLTKAELGPLLLARDFNLSSIQELLDFKKSKDTLDEEVFEEAGIKVRHKL